MVDDDSSYCQGRRQKNFQGMGQYKDKDQKIAQASLHLSILSVVGRGCTEHAPRAHLKGMLYHYQEPHIKINTLLEKRHFSGKCLPF